MFSNKYFGFFFSLAMHYSMSNNLFLNAQLDNTKQAFLPEKFIQIC